jgi:hypothetical protein
MDILNFISWIRARKVVSTVDADTTLIPIGVRDETRDDKYVTKIITVSDLAAQIGPGGGVTQIIAGTNVTISPIGGTGAVTINSSGGTAFTYEIGEYVANQGGVIFHRYLEGGNENYLVVALTNQSTSQVWSNIDNELIGPTAQSLWDGLSNSNAIVNQPGETSSAAALCLNLTSGGKNDWYLPSIQELNKLWNNYLEVSKTLSQTSGATLLNDQNYWSSVEVSDDTAWYFSFSNGLAFDGLSKYNTYYVRAIRKFSL